ncbi:MAG: hypothetical protein IPL18_14735 [Sphingomonadales bacterium]|nr:hypothetical protein [Sphingomonadales bacterium]
MYLTNFSMGRVEGAVKAGEATAQKDALALVTTDSVVRFDLGNNSLTAVYFKNYGGSNAATQDATNYAAGKAFVSSINVDSVIATGLGTIDFKAAGNNSPELNFNNQQNYFGINADLDLRGDDRDNTLYANTGKDTVEGREVTTTCLAARATTRLSSPLVMASISCTVSKMPTTIICGTTLMSRRALAPLFRISAHRKQVILPHRT